MNGHLLTGDEAWQGDKALVTLVTPLIAQLSAYVMRYLDADAGRTEPISTEDERALGVRVADLGTALQDRADRREQLAGQPFVVTVEAVQPANTQGHET